MKKNELKEARLNAGLTQKKVSELTLIPIRTLQDWEANISAPPAYVKRWYLEDLEKHKA